MRRAAVALSCRPCILLWQPARSQGQGASVRPSSCSALPGPFPSKHSELSPQRSDPRSHLADGKCSPACARSPGTGERGGRPPALPHRTPVLDLCIVRALLTELPWGGGTDMASSIKMTPWVHVPKLRLRC